MSRDSPKYDFELDIYPHFDDLPRLNNPSNMQRIHLGVVRIEERQQPSNEQIGSSAPTKRVWLWETRLRGELMIQCVEALMRIIRKVLTLLPSDYFEGATVVKDEFEKWIRLLCQIRAMRQPLLRESHCIYNFTSIASCW